MSSCGFSSTFLPYSEMLSIFPTDYLYVIFGTLYPNTLLTNCYLSLLLLLLSYTSLFILDISYPLSRWYLNIFLLKYLLIESSWDRPLQSCSSLGHRHSFLFFPFWVTPTMMLRSYPWSHCHWKNWVNRKPVTESI